MGLAVSKLAVIFTMMFPMVGAGVSTAHFHCALNHGGFAVFQVHRGSTEGVAHFYKPSGGQWIVHLGSQKCSAVSCYVGARASGRKGWKLGSIVEHSPLPVILEMHKCL